MLKKIKRRYVAVEIESEARISAQMFMDALWGAIVKLYGEYGASQTGLVLIHFNEDGQSAVIRSALASLDVVQVALTSITSIANKPAALRIASTSGTLKALARKAKQ